MDKPLTRLSKKKKREKTQITSNKNKRGVITTDPKDTVRIIKEYNEQLYTHKFDNLDENGPVP